MPKITEERRASRRDQILDAALRCFTERGFQATSMADIITASGLSAGAIYGYFRGKREIAIAGARRAIGDRVDDLAGLTASAPVSGPAEAVRHLVDALDRDGVPPALIVQLWGEAATDRAFQEIAAAAFATLRDGFRHYLARWAVQEGKAPAASAGAWADDAVPVLLASAQGYFVQSALIPDFDREQFFAGIRRVFG